MSQQNKLHKPDAIFWDWDGTLVDSYRFLHDAHNHTLGALGFSLFKEGEYKQYFGKPRDVLYTTIYEDRADDAQNIFAQYVSDNRDLLPPIEAAESFLRLMHEHNVPMGIVSNKKAVIIREEVKHFGWEHYFEIIIGAGDAAADKPSPAPLELALSSTEITPHDQHVWFVGDTENDLACVRDTGCSALFFDRHRTGHDLIMRYNPAHVFDCYKKLTEFWVAL